MNTRWIFLASPPHQISTFNTERRKTKRKEREVVIVAVLAEHFPRLPKKHDILTYSCFLVSLKI
jgi:hypothetical protein